VTALPSGRWFHVDPNEDPVARRAEIERLRKAISSEEARAGHEAPVPKDREKELRRLIAERNVRLGSVLYRIQHLRRDIHRLETEAAALRNEVAGYEAGLRVLLGDVLAEADEWAAPLWSPVPLLGYRMWKRRNGRLHGARALWEQPRLEAQCVAPSGLVRDSAGVPHTNGECRRPQCGIYAFKGVDVVISGLAGRDNAVGLVALSGKVVEHDRGYRSRHAEVVALAAAVAGTVHCSADPEWVAGVFSGSDPATLLQDRAEHVGARPGLIGAVRRFFEIQEARYLDQWTSGNPNE
jgi:hypothetical protein